MYNRFRQFMYGRYGTDQLSVALVIFSVIISVILMFVQVPFIRLISWIPLIIVLLRVFSRNTSKRYEENQKFLKIYNPIQNKIKIKISHSKDKQNKYFKCKGCNATLRVPRGKGKIDITCPKCHTKARKRT